MPFVFSDDMSEKAFMPSTVGELLRSIRESKGLTIDDLAEKSGLNRDHIGRLERGETTNPRRGTMKSIADALGVSLLDLEPSVGHRKEPRYEVFAQINPESRMTKEEKKFFNEWQDIQDLQKEDREVLKSMLKSLKKRDTHSYSGHSDKNFSSNHRDAKKKISNA